MRVVAVGDIGVVDNMVHIGDEAMFGALVDALRARGVDSVTGISSNPAESARRYGIGAVEPIGFGRDRKANQQRMRDALTGAADERTRAVVDAVRTSDGVVIAGGGNVSSLWPHHIFERATLASLAVALGKPLVVTGQTIGPDLEADDVPLVRELLSSARLVGLREPSSHALVTRLGVASPVQLTVDDASYLVDESVEPGGYALVSLANHVAGADRDAVAHAVAALLDSLPVPVRFLAHFGSLDPAESRGDSLMHDRVIAAMSTPATVIAPTDAKVAARLARGASFVVSSRYHPVVFAVPAGVPAIGIPVDDYTTVKLTGALGNFGQDGVLPVEHLLAGEGPALAARLWRERDRIRSDAAERADVQCAASSAWWDRVIEALHGT